MGQPGQGRVQGRAPGGGVPKAKPDSGGHRVDQENADDGMFRDMFNMNQSVRGGSGSSKVVDDSVDTEARMKNLESENANLLKDMSDTETEGLQT